VPAGPYACEGAQPEYESIGALATMCLNDNVESVIRANDLCNRYGVDIWGRRHLEKVLREYVGHHNRQRLHRGLSRRVPHGEGREPVVFTSTAQVQRRDVLGGLIHEYDLAA
jgi:Aldehyde ferredoxin oxidoreductase, domains 2 & 3